jgi:uncharacterized SAM-binding protein YcdF (DUF218 family)
MTMFLFLSKFLPLLIYPVGLSTLLILASIALARHRRLHQAGLILALLLLGLGGNRWTSMALVRSLEWRYLPSAELTDETSLDLAEVIILLAGSTHSAQYPRPFIEVNRAGDRVIYAARLYNQGKAPRIFLSGGRIEWMESGDSPAEDMAVLLEMLGVPRQAMWFEDASRTTAESAQIAWEQLSAQGIHRIILVTSASHMPRSVALFERQGFEVIPAPTDFSVTEAEWQRLTHPDPATILVNILPEAGNLAATTTSIKEYLGIFFYWLRGQV